MILIVIEFKITLPVFHSFTLCVFCLSVSIVPELCLSHLLPFLLLGTILHTSVYSPSEVISTELVFSK